jgi:hypothetical protein
MITFPPAGSTGFGRDGRRVERNTLTLPACDVLTLPEHHVLNASKRKCYER